jgi:hypothetical protein
VAAADRPSGGETQVRRWRLDPREVISGYTSASAPQTILNNLPEPSDIRGYSVWLQHSGTELRVEGTVPPGQYSAKQLELMEIELRKSLFAELELKVARHLGHTDI